MARLLVSVRSADEAVAALEGGADIIDVKEPTRGSLGCADPALWNEVRRVVPRTTPLSVALGEASDWSSCAVEFPTPAFWNGISFAKMGLAESGPDWLDRWMSIKSRIETNFPTGCSWVAVIYADWEIAKAPHPDPILQVALQDPSFQGILVDTWNKGAAPAFRIDHEWRNRLNHIRTSGKFLAWAGGLGLAEIEQFTEWKLAPDIIAVRGSACREGNRLGAIDSHRVSQLRQAAAQI